MLPARPARVFPAARRSVLLVEDDDDIREALGELLASLDIHVEAAADGLAGLALLSRLPPPGLVLLDQRMPGLSGEDFLGQARVRGLLEGVPVVLMSGAVRPGAPGMPGVVAQLLKPFEVGALLELLERHLA